ncbi:hypothetical protein POX_e07322 [Penicillium oxalicum]|uniref:DUF1993 domain-containing protein n=1 Tax=Penicillium oxalicum (strain 114-2 / CGMCC 5302) TaxID=933388 RepID=S8AQV9_PENO1|nr:hypothetical protein POX_e07322 [Penicillium oxalicum]EPS28353.1 hypothetical protein PDE_03299 [Penicillium oxalicum 114-2]KAI2789292.1 hypothetical protein POX_e07322 [Penicillium oxalicum]
MSTPLYDYSVPTFIKGLKALSNILQKAADFAQEKGIAVDEVVGWKLAEDMLPVSFQVQTASNVAKNSLPRIAGYEENPIEDNEKTVAELQARIAKTIEMLEKAEASQFAGKEKNEVKIQAGPKLLEFEAQSYLTNFALPNFYFHLTTAYAIFRSKGVQLGKFDYLVPFIQ